MKASRPPFCQAASDLFLEHVKSAVPVIFLCPGFWISQENPAFDIVKYQMGLIQIHIADEHSAGIFLEKLPRKGKHLPIGDIAEDSLCYDKGILCL